MTRQKRVTVAADVPACSASSVMDRFRGAVGLSSSRAAILSMAADICGRLARMRCATPGLASADPARFALRCARAIENSSHLVGGNGENLSHPEHEVNDWMMSKR